jgi:hypothetical protein
MNTTAEISSVLRRTLDQPQSGIVSLVDAILNLCRGHNFQLDWQADRCLVRPLGGDWEEVTDLPIRKSVFRAILARISVLCNEQLPNAISPYGGRARLTVGENPSGVFQVIWTNSPAQQRLEILPDVFANDALRENPHA